MRRRLFTITAALSAILFVLTAGLWVRTFFAQDDVYVEPWNQRKPQYRILHIRSSGELVSVWYSSATYGPPQFRPPVGHVRFAGLRWIHRTERPRPQGLSSWLWWDYYVDRPGTGGTEHVWRIQFRPWLPLVPATVWFLICLRRFLHPFLFRQRMARQGRCTTCGYDLRATPGRCPECGAEPVRTD